MSTFYDLPKFDSQILIYKKDIEFEIRKYYVNKARVLLLNTYMWYWYKFQSNAAFLLIILITFHLFILFGAILSKKW